MSTSYVTHPRYVEHDIALQPEHAGRIRAVWRAIEQAGLLPRLNLVEAPFLDEEAILDVHTQDYIKLLRTLETFDHSVRLDADTYANPVSYDIARYSAGGVVKAVDLVLRGEADNVLAAVRPPGHHAVAHRAMGFCLLANVALAARHAQRQFQVERILIVDYDVHHGNGTEAIFYNDPGVLFISTHQEGIYPGTGAVRDVGRGAGVGYTINIPMPAGCGDASYLRVFDEIVIPAARRYQPQLVLVSAGFDAHWTDPLAWMRLTLDGYATLAKKVYDVAQECCDGKIAYVMEGGYNLDALANGMANLARLLVGDSTSDSIGEPTDRHSEPDISRRIAEVRQVHAL